MSPLPGNVNNSVDRALRLLDLFDEQRVAVSASDVAELLGTTRATVYPTLNALLSRGYLDRDERGRFVLGMKLVERSGQKLAQLDVRSISQPMLRGLARRLNANVHLASLHGDEVLYLGREQGRPAVVLREVIGRRVSPHCTALGKALLAFLPYEDASRIAHELEYTAYTPHTIQNASALLDALKLVRKDGIAFELEEFHVGSACVAAPIRGQDGKIIAAVSVSKDADELRVGERRQRVVAEVLGAANRISASLGFSERQGACGSGFTCNAEGP